MDTKHNDKIAYLIFLCVLTATAVAMRAFASFVHLSPLGYYTGKLTSASNLTVLLGLLFLLTFGPSHWKDTPPRVSFHGPLTYMPAAPLALTLIFMGATFIFRKAEGALEKVALPLLGLLAIIGAFYFFFALFLEKKLSDLRAVFGAILSLYLILYAGYLYFDASLPINAATKICDQMAYVSASLFFLLETRVSLGRVRWPLYTAAGLAASLLTAYSAIPSLIVYIFSGRLICNSLAELLVTVMLTVYVFCRTSLSLLAKAEAPTALMAALQAQATLREEEVKANGPLPFEGAAQQKDFETAEPIEQSAEDFPSEGSTEVEQENETGTEERE